MDEQNGETKEEEVTDEGLGELEIEKTGTRMRVDKEMKGVYFRDQMKHSKMSD